MAEIKKKQNGAAKTKAPKSGPIIPAMAEARMLEIMRRERTPADVKTTLATALQGDISLQGLLFEAMADTWPRLQKNLSEIARECANSDWQVNPGKGDGEPDDATKERASFIEDSILGMRPDDKRDVVGFKGLIKALVYSYFTGFNVSEVYWELKEEGMAPTGCKVLSPRHYGFPTRGEDELMLNVKGERSSDLEAFPEHNFIVGVHKGHAGHAAHAAPLRVLTTYWLAATYGLKWFLQFAQLFGIPYRWAEYANDQDRVKVETMLQEIGSSGWGAFPAGTKLNFESVTQSGESIPQKVLVELADKQCDIFVLGQTLTSDVQDSGSRALGDVHKQVRSDVVAGINEWISEVLNGTLVDSLIKLNYGEDDEGARPEFSAKKVEVRDETSLVTRDKALFKEMKLPVSKDWLYERHGVPIPKEDEELFEPPEPEGFGLPGAPGAPPPKPGEKPKPGAPKPGEKEPGKSPSPGKEPGKKVASGYDPNQPRAPEGSPGGGRWTKRGDVGHALDATGRPSESRRKLREAGVGPFEYDSERGIIKEGDRILVVPGAASEVNTDGSFAAMKFRGIYPGEMLKDVFPSQFPEPEAIGLIPSSDGGDEAESMLNIEATFGQTKFVEGIRERWREGEDPAVAYTEIVEGNIPEILIEDDAGDYPTIIGWGKIYTPDEARSKLALDNYLDPGRNEGLPPRTNYGSEDPITDPAGWRTSGIATKEQITELKAQVADAVHHDNNFHTSTDQARDFVASWAESSNDNNFESLTTQEAAAQAFGGELTGWQKSKLRAAREQGAFWESTFGGKDSDTLTDELQKATGHTTVKRHKSDLLSEMYLRTQEDLKAAGIEELTLYRGVDIPSARDHVSVGEVVKLTNQNALESWSSDKSTAQSFAKGSPDGIVLKAIVNRGKVVSTPRTGFGCLKEKEYVLHNGGDDMIAAVIGDEETFPVF